MEDKKVEAPVDDIWNADDVTEASDELFKFTEVGAVLSGLIVHHKNQVMDNGPANFYTLLTNKGEVTFIATSSLHEKLTKFKLNEFLVKITFEESRPSKGSKQDFKVFSVKATPSTESKLAAMGIVVFSNEE